MDAKQWLRTNPDRLGAWLAIVLGAVVLFIGWHGASNTEYPAEQLPYILSGGIGGVLLVGVGATLLISADLRDEWHKLDRIERRLAPEDAHAEVVDPLPARAPEQIDNGSGGRVRRQLSARGSAKT